jgi:Domain of unknown function (DUF5060)/Protein of unknown function (DUF4038)
MGFRFAFGILALTWALARATFAAQAAPVASTTCANTPSYSTCEMVFELSPQDAGAHPNPYTSVELTVTFRSPRQHSYALPGYWDGANRMVVRFSPVEPGNWDYLVTSNIAAWNNQRGNFSAAQSDSKGFIHPAALHHWTYTEKANGLDQGHLWMGVSEPRYAYLDEAASRAVADARATQKFTHFRVSLYGAAADPAIFRGPDVPNTAFFQALDQRIRYLNQKGMIADIVLSHRPADVLKYLANPDSRRRFVRYVVGRYAAFNVTWQAVDQFEGDPDGRALLKEMGTVLKQADPYQHPRTAGALLTSAPLLDDHWMDFVSYGTADDNIGAVEHQLYPVPFVNGNFGREDSGAGKQGPNDVDAATFRHRLWNATMNGQYVTYANTGSGQQYLDSPGAKAMSVWFDVMSATRHWEMEPFFDIDNGRAIALEDSDYLVYIEKPGPIELVVERHAYDILWINPANGETTRKKWTGDHFTSEPPDRSHDWLLRVVRLSRIESMGKSYKLESRQDGDGNFLPIALQEIEANTAKVPFIIEQPTGDLPLSAPVKYSAKITKDSRGTRSVRWLWVGDVAADGQGFRVLATAQSGTFQLPPDIATQFPAIMHLRLYGMNANGKVYEVDSGCGIVK